MKHVAQLAWAFHTQAQYLIPYITQFSYNSSPHTTPVLTQLQSSHNPSPHTTPVLTQLQSSHNPSPHTTPVLTQSQPSYKPSPHTTPASHNPSPHTTPVLTQPKSSHFNSYETTRCTACWLGVVICWSCGMALTGELLWVMAAGGDNWRSWWVIWNNMLRDLRERLWFTLFSHNPSPHTTQIMKQYVAGALVIHFVLTPRTHQLWNMLRDLLGHLCECVWVWL
jgi:hypothetical protein